MTYRNIVLAGAVLLVAGLFTPILTLPLVGSVNLFNNGTNIIAISLMMLAALAAGLAISARDRLAIWPGLSASSVLLYLFLRLQYSISEIRESVSEQLADNPFAGLAQGALGAIQLQWGWLVLGAGAGLIVYAGYKARTADDAPLFGFADNPTRLAAGASILLLAGAIIPDAIDQFGGNQATDTDGVMADADANAAAEAALADPTATDGPTAEEARYIRDNLKIYDLDARYFDSILDGRIPGVRFKLRNNGNRTLDRVTVRVMFQDGEGKAIAEEEYDPVLVSEYNFGGDNTPLRPNYIWQQDPDQFYTAKGVPSEWKTGAATARIVDIEFGPTE